MGTFFIILAAAFVLALFMGRLANRFHIPRVTGYLLAGILIGPSLHEMVHGMPLLTRDMLDSFKPIMDIALAMIVFSVGLECRGELFKRFGRKLFKVSIGEISTTLLFTVVLIWLADFFIVHAFAMVSKHAVGSSLYLALFLGIIAITTAPAATLFVIREYEAEGPLTEIVLLLICLNNWVAIVGFTILTDLVVHPVTVLMFLKQLMLPLVLGGAVGFFMSWWTQYLERPREFQLLLLGVLALVIGAAHFLGINMMLSILFTGAVFANMSPKFHAVHNALRKIDFPVYVLFFVLSGASMHLDALRQVGLLGLVFIIARTAGKMVGAYWGARWAGLNEDEQKYLGFTLMAQAGVAIGLSQTLSREWSGGHVVETIILGSLIFFEMAGPLSVRHGLVRAGEVSLLSLLVKKAPDTLFENFYQVINHFRDAIGLPSYRRLRHAGDILVKHVIKKNVETIPDTMHFNHFLKNIAYSCYDRFPVVNKEGKFIGVVDYQDVRDMIFEPIMGDLIIVRDLIKPNPLVVHGDQKMTEVFRIFRKHPNISYLPVVDPNDPQRLIGILSHNTMLSLYREL